MNNSSNTLLTTRNIIKYGLGALSLIISIQLLKVYVDRKQTEEYTDFFERLENGNAANDARRLEERQNRQKHIPTYEKALSYLVNHGHTNSDNPRVLGESSDANVYHVYYTSQEGITIVCLSRSPDRRGDVSSSVSYIQSIRLVSHPNPADPDSGEIQDLEHPYSGGPSFGEIINILKQVTGGAPNYYEKNTGTGRGDIIGMVGQEGKLFYVLAA